MVRAYYPGPTFQYYLHAVLRGIGQAPCRVRQRVGTIPRTDPSRPAALGAPESPATGAVLGRAEGSAGERMGPLRSVHELERLTAEAAAHWLAAQFPTVSRWLAKPLTQ